MAGSKPHTVVCWTFLCRGLRDRSARFLLLEYASTCVCWRSREKQEHAGQCERFWFVYESPVQLEHLTYRAQSTPIYTWL